MIGTLLSAAFALFIAFYPMHMEANIPWTIVMVCMVILAALFLAVHAGLQVFAWAPLVKAGRSITPRVADLFHHDPGLRWASWYLTLFPLATFLIILVIALFSNINKIDLLAIWILLLGIAVDVLHYSLKRILKFFNPFNILGMLTQTAKSDVQEDRDMDLHDCIDAISEVATKGIETSSTALPNDALNELQIITRNFLQSAKSIAHWKLKDEQPGNEDKVTYALFFLFQRIELINDKAIEKRLEPVCSTVVTTLGKIAIHAAKFDVSLASYPIHVLGRCALKAQQNNLPDVGVKGNIALLEVAKAIMTETDVTYQEIKEPFAVLINDMHEISKEIFRQNKETDIEELRKPYRLLKEYFTTEKMASHPDTPNILAQLNQVIAEFDALELVLKTIPPLTTEEPKEKPPETQK